jgi:hypothetical protein
MTLDARQLNWRMHGTALNFWYVHELQARQFARQIAHSAREFSPEVIWVVPELGATRTGLEVARRLRLPLHLTLHDAHETARHLVPRLYYPFFASAMKGLMERARSVDSISEELLAHEVRTCGARPDLKSMVFYPSVRRDLVVAPRQRKLFRSDGVRRIGLCGSMRVSEGQWGRFLGVLGRLPFAIEIIAIAYEDLFHNLALPANVTIEKRPYCKTEAAVIGSLTDAGVDACYLGLWKDPKQELFSRTSLSAKLTTYVAAGVPVIVDGPETSVAWRLIRECNGGVLVENDAGRAAMTMERLFTDLEWWSKLSDGARKLCLDQFDLEKNAARLATLLVEDANGR